MPWAAARRLMPLKYKIPYKPEAMEDLISREWFKRMWTIQELAMAQEPVILCGKKTVRWYQLCWGIVHARDLAGNRKNTEFSEVFDSVIVTQSLWLSLYIKNEFGEPWIRRWLLGRSGMQGSNARKRLLDFMDNYGRPLQHAQISLIAIAILARLSMGYSHFIVWVLLFLILSCIATSILTPPWKDNNAGVLGQVKTLLGVQFLHKTRKRQAAKPVDKIFALYGVFQELGIPVQKPDYSKSVGEVYFEFTCTMIKWYSSLRILVETSGPGLPDTPSWVPDWSRSHYHFILGGARAADDSSPRFSFSSCNRELTSSGSIVDKVTFRTEMLQELNGSPVLGSSAQLDTTLMSQALFNINVLMQWMTAAIQAASNQKNYPVTDALFATIHSDIDFAVENRAQLRSLFTQWYSVLTADYSTFSTLSPSELACALALSTNYPLNRYHLERCKSIAKCRIFFITSSGYLGTGPPFMRTGDIVSLLAGFHLPIILREEGSYYRVVGTAYVHGLMQGEAWPRDEAKLREITLI